MTSSRAVAILCVLGLLLVLSGCPKPAETKPAPSTATETAEPEVHRDGESSSEVPDEAADDEAPLDDEESAGDVDEDGSTDDEDGSTDEEDGSSDEDE